MILRERVVEEFCELVTIDAPSYKERQMVDLLKGKLEALGFEVIEDQVGKLIGGNCGNLLAFLPANDPELAKLEPILFSAHMDTVVPAIGKKAIVHEDGRITSDGMTVLGADDVSGIVSILEGIRSIKESGRSHRGIEVLFTVAEEVFTKGCSNFDCTKLRSKEAYILDLSGRIGTAAYTAPSIISFEIKVHGHAAHAGFEPEKGVHAIAIAANAISRITLGRVDDNLTVNIGSIQGGDAINIVPKYCVVRGEVRGFQHDQAAARMEEITSIFKAAALELGGSIECDVTVNCKAYDIPKDAKPVLKFLSCCEKLGLPSELVRTLGGSDFNVLAERGLEGLVIASGMNAVHSCQEYTCIEDLLMGASIVEELICMEE